MRWLGIIPVETHRLTADRVTPIFSAAADADSSFVFRMG